MHVEWLVNAGLNSVVRASPSFVDLGKEYIGLHGKNYKVFNGHIDVGL